MLLMEGGSLYMVCVWETNLILNYCQEPQIDDC